VYYADIADISITIGGGQFVGPSAWYIPYLWVGVESDPIPIRASWSPINEVNLTMSAPDLIFNPPTLSFRNGSEQQYFTITPTYVSNDQRNYPTITVSFLVSGIDYTLFTAPPSFAVNVQQRYFQMVWSADLDNEVRYLHKQYEVWATVNYITSADLVSVTPVSPYFSFNPPVLHFSSSTTRIEFTATVTGVVGFASIDYIIGGEDGGWYAPIPSTYFYTAIRPLSLTSAVLAPDTRAAGVYVYLPTFGELATYHVYSFVINSSVLPDSSLTITPKCNHAQFSPSSITVAPDQGVTDLENTETIRTYYFNLSQSYLEANFSVKPLAAGVHEVWFELSGDDANYYDRPGHMFFAYNLVMHSSSIRLLSSAFAAMAMSVLLALLL